MTLTFGSLFAGIGGIDLGLERAGMRCAWQVEIDEYCNRVLAKHWPDVPRFRDVRGVGAHNLPRVVLIAGGFPCQDISNAGKRAGIDGERSGLWTEFVRIIGELRPRYALLENVSALLHRGLGRVLGDLAAIGYDAEWSTLSACALGAPHTRERVFILAYPRCVIGKRGMVSKRGTTQGDDGDTKERQEDRHVVEVGTEINSRIRGFAEWWRTESAVPRMAHGVPSRVDRLRGLGNAVVPQVAEFVGRQIVAHQEHHHG